MNIYWKTYETPSQRRLLYSAGSMFRLMPNDASTIWICVKSVLSTSNNQKVFAYMSFVQLAGYVGCFIDDSRDNYRDLIERKFGTVGTIDECRQFCLGQKRPICALQNGSGEL